MAQKSLHACFDNLVGLLTLYGFTPPPPMRLIQSEVQEYN